MTVRNLKVFLAAIMFFNYAWMKEPGQHQEGENNEEKVARKINKERIGSLKDDGHYYLFDEEIAYIAKHFCILHQNRQDSLLNSKKQSHLQRTLQSAVQNQFRPQTCKAS